MRDLVTVTVCQYCSHTLFVNSWGFKLVQRPGESDEEFRKRRVMMVWSPILFWNLTELPLSLSPTKLVCVLLNFRPRHPLHQSYPLWSLCSKRLHTMLLWKACQIEFPHQATRISNVSMIIIVSPPMTLQQVLANDEQDQNQQQAWKRIQMPVCIFFALCQPVSLSFRNFSLSSRKLSLSSRNSSKFLSKRT